MRTIFTELDFSRRILGLFLLIIIISSSACREPEPGPEPEPIPVDPLYSFFVAGHTYGHIDSSHAGLHPPFEDKYPMLNDDPFLEMGFLTGDMVRFPSARDWDEVDSSVARIEMPVYYVAGNHDVINRPLYESRYGITYYYFKQNNDLFIVLDANLTPWLIIDEQLDFLKSVLDQEAGAADNIFVFFHQLLWWMPDNEFGNLRVNNKLSRPDTVNFWTEVEPLFNDLPNNVVMFAGDLGAHASPGWDSYMYYQYDNITYIGSGMGNYKEDNMVIVEVLPDKTLRYRLIALNGDDVNALGELTDYRLP
jgi:hypothetical protein